MPFAFRLPSLREKAGERPKINYKNEEFEIYEPYARSFVCSFSWFYILW